MDKKTLALSAMIIGLVAVSGVAFAFSEGFPGFGLKSENREAINEAIQSNDYEAWKQVMGETLTEEHFNRLVDMHESKEVVKRALEDSDYEVWRKAVENLERPKITDVITEENFDRLVQLHEAKMSGDYETVGEIREELGIGPMRHGMLGPFRYRVGG